MVKTLEVAIARTLAESAEKYRVSPLSARERSRKSPPVQTQKCHPRLSARSEDEREGKGTQEGSNRLDNNIGTPLTKILLQRKASALDEIFVQIAPIGVHSLNQLDLPRAIPAFELLLARDRCVNV